jgi:squalene synthase HpnC
VDLTSFRPPPADWSPASAYQWCRSLARRHYENFPVASLFIPPTLRDHVAAVYAFARIADDLADEPGLTQEQRLAYLNEWEEMLTATASDRVHPVFVALSRTVHEHALPVQLFTDLLSAFRQDVVKNRYQNYLELRDYCRRSADPVGRIILRLFGLDDPTLDAQSDAICTGLQLTNFWQDFSQDLSRNRIYIPREDMDRFGIYLEDESFREHEDAFRELMKFEVSRTRVLFQEGKPLLNRVKSRLSMQLRLTWHGGMRVLEKIERSRYNVLHTRPRLLGIDAGLVAFRAIVRT